MGEKWQAKICPQCKTNEMEKGHRICKPCRQSNAKTRTKENNKLAKAERAAARKQLKCKCGCGLPVIYPSRYATDDCREKARKEVCKRYREGQQEQAEEVKPVPRPILDDAERDRLDVAKRMADIAQEQRLNKERAKLNPELLLMRVMQGAIMPAPGVLQ